MNSLERRRTAAITCSRYHPTQWSQDEDGVAEVDVRLTVGDCPVEHLQ